ncbi:DUF4097 family beta strand repeat-containing protein [Foetidibacter luteolus]|uniref:DUF4097 family beta strand repeat-containing protein n=1 Tax=Foetidibacter luteolus TaxID=2608880 RepID=UPI00129AAD01|nr:hypothetical protein [Foetidibacter luteolus]
MKKHFLFAAIALMSVSLKAQSTNEEPYLTKSLANQTVSNVKVETSGGSISVSGVATGEARLEMYVRGNNGNDKLSKEEIKERLEEYYDVNINFSGNKLSAIAKNKHSNMNWKKSLSISFRIYVPKNVSTNLATSGGSIKLLNLSGTQEFATSGGSLHVDGVSGKIDGATSGGSIKVLNSQDDIELATSGGSIEASDCKGTLKLATSGGSLKLNNLSGTIEAGTSGGSVSGGNISGKLSAHTSGGSIRLSDLACSLETATSGGHITVGIKQLGEYVKISNSGGNVDVTLPKDKGLDLALRGDKIKVSPMNNFSGSTDDDRIDGKLNGGGVPVSIKADGRVSITLE